MPAIDLHEGVFPGNTSAYNAAQLRLSGKKLSALVGAGASIPLRPTWIGLLNTLLQEIESKGLLPVDHIVFLKELAGNDLLEAASQIEQSLGKENFRARFCRFFTERENEATSIHRAILDIPFDFIATTNYDNGLAVAYSNKFAAPAKILNCNEATRLSPGIMATCRRLSNRSCTSMVTLLTPQQ